MRRRWDSDSTTVRSGTQGRRALVWGVVWVVLALALIASAGAAQAQAPASPGSPVADTTPDRASPADAASIDRLAVQGQASAALSVAATTSFDPRGGDWDARWLWGSLAAAPLLLVALLWLRDRLSLQWVPPFLGARASRP